MFITNGRNRTPLNATKIDNFENMHNIHIVCSCTSVAVPSCEFHQQGTSAAIRTQVSHELANPMSRTASTRLREPYALLCSHQGGSGAGNLRYVILFQYYPSYKQKRNGIPMSFVTLSGLEQLMYRICLYPGNFSVQICCESNYHISGHYPSFCLLYKTQLYSTFTLFFRLCAACQCLKHFIVFSTLVVILKI
jgi:hypothetical protein